MVPSSLQCAGCKDGDTQREEVPAHFESRGRKDVGRIVHAAHFERGDGVGVSNSSSVHLKTMLIEAIRSFLAGALPLSMTLSSSQLRLISTIGMGVLVGTSLIVIIPEGIEAVYSAGGEAHLHTRRSLLMGRNLEVPYLSTRTVPSIRGGPIRRRPDRLDEAANLKRGVESDIVVIRQEDGAPATPPANEAPKTPATGHDTDHEKENHRDPPTFYIGLSLILGFVLMFLIDKLPRHASETMQPPPAPRQISLSNLAQGLSSQHSIDEEESESFLHSLTPTPKQTRSLATTTGLVIHAAADGIAMGASASGSNTKLGFIIFVAIMIHKAPAAFGLTSVLLKQGLSKRAARGHLIVFSLAAPFGALSTWLVVHMLGGGGLEGENGQWWTGMLLLFSAGTFL